MPVKFTPAYMEARRRFHDNHPDAEAAEIRAHLGGLGLDEEAQQEIVKRNAPDLAHHPAMEQIGAMPKGEQAKAVAALHDKEQSGPSGENGATDKYLQDHGKMAKSSGYAALSALLSAGK